MPFSFWSRECLVIMRFPACFSSPYHFWYLSKSAYWKRRAFNLKPQVSGFSRLSFIKTPANERTNPDDLIVRFRAAQFFYPPPMWWIVIRFVYLVSGQKHELWGKAFKYFNCSPIPLFSRFFAIHCFPAIFCPSCLTYESSCESFPSKNKLSGKNCAAAGLNFQQPEILKRFRAIWPFSFRLFSKLFPFNNFTEFMLFPAGYTRRKGNWSWLKA